jgi:hypothetical protein
MVYSWPWQWVRSVNLMGVVELAAHCRADLHMGGPLVHVGDNGIAANTIDSCKIEVSIDPSWQFALSLG